MNSLLNSAKLEKLRQISSGQVAAVFPYDIPISDLKNL
jgi:hypothetical protein